MKAIVFAALLAVAVALPRPDDEPIAILEDDRVAPEGGAFSTAFKTENGISVQESGAPGEKGQTNMQGTFSFPDGDGGVIEVQWVANEAGFQPESDVLPVAPAFPHPIPEFVLEQIAFAEEQRKLEDN